MTVNKLSKRLILLLLILPAPLSALADAGHQQYTQHYKNSLFKVTENGRYSVELVVKADGLRVGNNTLDLIVHDNTNHDVVGAEVRVVPSMPGMSNDGAANPVVKEQGGGLYRAENVALSMGGHWNLDVSVSKDGRNDRVVFALPNVAAAHAQGDAMGHDHGHAAPMAMTMEKGALDTSTTHKTAHFRVAYTSDAMPIPVNRFHAWKLKVTTPQGKPVKGAKITIEGDMPAHGHGLPTKPEVTREVADGVYLVEGMKFSMPGHWVMQFHIAANGMQDTAAFNLMLK